MSWSKPRAHPDLVTPVCQGSVTSCESDAAGRRCYKGALLFAGPYSETSRTNLTILASVRKIHSLFLSNELLVRRTLPQPNRKLDSIFKERGTFYRRMTTEHPSHARSRSPLGLRVTRACSAGCQGRMTAQLFTTPVGRLISSHFPLRTSCELRVLEAPQSLLSRVCVNSFVYFVVQGRAPQSPADSVRM